jgi:hypothetical protein
MKLIPVAVLALLSSAVAQTSTLHEAHHAADSQEPQVTLCDLVAHPKDYAGKPVKVKATVASDMEFSIFRDDSCQPAPDKANLVLAKFSSGQFESPLGKKLSKLLKQRQQAEVTVVGIFTDPGRFIGHQACCRYKLEVQQLLGVEELKAKADKERPRMPRSSGRLAQPFLPTPYQPRMPRSSRFSKAGISAADRELYSSVGV